MFDDMTDEELEAKAAEEDARCDPNLSLDEELRRVEEELDACLTSLAEKESQLELKFTGTAPETQTPPPKKNNRLLFIAGGTALLGGSYYIYKRRS